MLMLITFEIHIYFSSILSNTNIVFDQSWFYLLIGQLKDILSENFLTK